MTEDSTTIELKDNDTSQILSLTGEEVSASIDFNKNEVTVAMSNEVYEQLEEQIREHEPQNLETGDNPE
jgi:hypothetical protein